MASKVVEATFMANKFTRSIVLAAIGAGACFATGVASAQTCLNATQGPTDLGPNASCLVSGEREIFLEVVHGTNTVHGNVGSQSGLPVVEFTSSASLSSGSGNSGITAVGGSGSFSTLDFTIPGHTFTDFLFTVQMAGTGGVHDKNLTVTAVSGTTMTPLHTYNNLAHSQPVDFVFTDPAGVTGIDLSSTTGITHAGSFEISGVSAPEPSSWAMMVLGLVGVGLAALRRTGRSRLSAAMT